MSTKKTKKMSRAMRNQVANLLSQLACQEPKWLYRTWDLAPDGSELEYLAAEAFNAVSYAGGHTGGTWAYAEAESLVRSGWNPGDEVVRRPRAGG